MTGTLSRQPESTAPVGTAVQPLQRGLPWLLLTGGIVGFIAAFVLTVSNRQDLWMKIF